MTVAVYTKKDGKSTSSTPTKKGGNIKKTGGKAGKQMSSNGGGSSKKRKFDDKKNSRNVQDDASEKSASNKKRALKQERQSHRRHADSVVASKDIWNKLRLKTNTKQDNTKLMEELMTLLRGKFHEVAMQHDASRVVQAALQFGNEAQRSEIVNELVTVKDGFTLADMAKVQYAHFVVLKMIKYCARDDGSVEIIVKSFKGHIPKMAVHAVAARVVELLFTSFPHKRTASLKLELYGPQFALFSSGDLSCFNSANKNSQQPTLQSILSDQPEKKRATLEHVLSILNKGIEKSLFGFAYFQQLFAEYVTAASPNEIQAVSSSVSDHAIHFLSTRHGSRVVAECAAYGTVKDRKRIMKSLKGYTRSSLLHGDAYIALLRVVDVCDDTVAVQKSILAELLQHPEDPKKKKLGPDDNVTDAEKNETEHKNSPILDLALSESGSKLFLLLLSQNEATRRKYFNPTELEILRPKVTVIENGEEVPTSRKNPDTRRMELLQYIKTLLMELCLAHTGVLLRSRPGSKVLKEVCESFPSQDLAVAIVDACQEEDSILTGGNDAKELKRLLIFEDPVGHLALKHLLLSEAEKPNESEGLLLATVLFDRYQGRLMEIASSNRGAFVLAALVQVESVSNQVRKELERHKKEIGSLAKKGKTGEDKVGAGYEALLNAAFDGKAKK